MRTAWIAVAVLAAAALAVYPVAVGGPTTLVLTLATFGFLGVFAAVLFRRRALAGSAAFFFAFEYAAALILGRVPIDLYAALVGVVWLILLESLERASTREEHVDVDRRVAANRRRFFQLELATGGLAAGVALGAAATVGDRGDPALFVLGAGSALLAAALVLTTGRRALRGSGIPQRKRNDA